MTLHTTYFGPVEWYADLLHHADDITIDGGERYVKQTTRNHCLIATASGTQKLTVPVTAANGMLTKDVRISDHGNWRHLHWNALQSAYGESPFFDYYQDDIRPFFEQRWDYLFDFNEAIREKMCELLDIQPKVDYSKKFTVYSLSSCVPDYRMAIRPKNPEPDPDFTPKRYYQVYEQKHGFLPNLSILDLLFNMGPESIFYL